MQFPTKGVVIVTLCGALFAVANSPAQAQCRGRGGMSTMTNSMMNPMMQSGLQSPFGMQAQFGMQPNLLQAQQLMALAQLQALQQQYVLQAQLLALQQQSGLQSQPFGLQANANQQLAQGQNPANVARAQNGQTAKRQTSQRPAQKAVAKKTPPPPTQDSNN